MNQMKYKLTSIIVAFALTFGLIPHVGASSDYAPHSAGNSYYVAVNGSDLNTCTQSAPCKSFNKAMSLAQSGDTVYVTAGTYNQELIITKSGLTVIGQNAVIDTTAHTAIHVKSTAQNIVVRGFTVTRTRSHAVWIEGKFVTIEGNTVYHSVLENGSISNGVITCGNGQRGSAIKVNSPGSDVVIRGNTVYENCGEGIAATIAKNVVIENNNVRDNKGVNIYIDNSSFIQVRNNNSYCTKTSDKPIGIGLGEESYSGWGAQLRDVTVSGNTVTNCDIGIMAFQSDVGGTLTNITFSNNFIPSAIRGSIGLDTNSNQNVLISNNTYYTSAWIKNPAGVTLKDNVIGTKVTATATSNGSITPTITSTITSTVISTNTPTATVVASQTATLTKIAPSATVTPTTSGSNTATATPTSIGGVITQTSTPTITPTVTGGLNTPTSTPTVKMTQTQTATFTSTVAPSLTPIPATATSTNLPNPTRTPKPTKTPKPTQIPPQNPSGTFFDDLDPAFVYSGSWDNEVNKRKAYGGSFKMTSENGSFLTFTFTGQSFSILYTGGPAFRAMDVYVDDVLVGTINQRAGARTFQQQWDYSGILTPGVHTLKLVYVSDKPDKKGSIDAVIVR
ncbi:MAG TPA: hypothetical protein DIW23_00625 [Anaerolineae bacterium]|nr:hypothetical protein [Anaerolineae bacterium]